MFSALSLFFLCVDMFIVVKVMHELGITLQYKLEIDKNKKNIVTS